MIFKNKKAQDLSINFLVKFILAITLFGLGVGLLWTIFSHGTDLIQVPSNEFDQRILALNCNSKQTLCIGLNTAHIPAGENFLFDIRYYNNYAQPALVNYYFELLDEQGIPIDPDRGIKILPNTFNQTVLGRDDLSTSFMVYTDKTANRDIVYSVRIVANRHLEGEGPLDPVFKRITLYVD